MSGVLIQRTGVRVVRTRTMEQGKGALTVYAPSYDYNKTTTIHRLDEKGKELEAYYAPVTKYQNGDGETVYAATFPDLMAGSYQVYNPGTTSYQPKRITVFPGNIAEVTYT